MADSNLLSYIINHVFLPPKLPQSCDESAENYAGLCRVILRCAQEYREKVPEEERPRWDPVVKMLDNLCLLESEGGFSKEKVGSCIFRMNIGDVLALLIRKQNAGIVIGRHQDRAVFESFEVSPANEKIMSTQGRLICSYPGPAIAVATKIARDPPFVYELANFLSHMNVDVMDDAIPTTWKAGTKLGEIRDTTHPRYITELLTGILRGVGWPEDVTRISKRIADEVLWKDTLLPWRRSPIWLLIRVSLQTTLSDGHSNHSTYKSFIAFCMARILRDAVHAKFDSDLLSCMNKKVSRRLFKLGSDSHPFLTSEVLDVGILTNDLLQMRWKTAQKHHAEASLLGWDPSSLNIMADTQLSLKNSGGYIRRVLDGSKATSASPSFNPAEKRRFLHLVLYTSHTLIHTVRDHGVVALMDFERAVETGIDAWVSARLNDNGWACANLWSWIQQYSERAEKEYNGNPEAMSMMFLTLFELWVGLDKLCVHQCNLLLDYSPEANEDILRPLILHRSASISRLKRILIYVRTRHSRATRGESIFSGNLTQESFVIRYFENSQTHQTLKASIETKAHSDWHNKVEELTHLNRRHAELQQQAQQLSHDVDIQGNRLCKKKKLQCRKCRLEGEAASLSINVFEWPLPATQLEACATVIEMDCPLAFSIWREATYHLLRDICLPSRLRTKSSNPKAEKLLVDYDGLRSFTVESVTRRLTFASRTKSFLDSHYRKQSIPCLQDHVCLKNALQFSLYDTVSRVWHAIDGTDHTPNEIMANQVECHPDITLHEYAAFSGLRSGSHLQWLNILREVTSRQLSFQKPEVEMLFLQAAHQIGPLASDAEWEWHTELRDPLFCTALLQQLRDLKDAVKLNWMEVVTLRIIIALLSRVLSSPPKDSISELALAILQDVRGIAYRWIEQVSVRLRDATTEDAAAHDLQMRLCEIALTFRSTYDIESPQQQRIFANDHDVTRFITSGILLQENVPTQNAPQFFLQLLH
ncbi:hypothetical protein Moror_13419 [Moniliophthora roreri MCA 2997]|uniref:DUF6606 domain-containing protein n=1 Tax=Moniliophthora roreri (strain MCA 2997) TaxID=1381753 RepID=V2WKD0_MONRO|nr:hypothetical protein Moror_13419 [Moniliophthora roreri MCA 2997]